MQQHKAPVERLATITALQIHNMQPGNFLLSQKPKSASMSDPVTDVFRPNFSVYSSSVNNTT